MNLEPYHERICALCGCEESAHGGEDPDNPGDYTICTGCGEPCDFEEDENVEED